MTHAQPPLILVSPDVQAKGKEFADLSLSLSANYQRALIDAGAIPLTLPLTISPEVIADCVRHCQGVLLTGGDDVDPRLYGGELPAAIQQTVSVTPDAGGRDYREILLVNEVLRQRKPLLAICRGHQVVNVALGGTLVADIPSQIPGALRHRQMDKRSEVVHQVSLTEASLLAKIVGKSTLGVNSTHHQAIGKVAPPLRVSAASEDGVIESLELKPEAARELPFLLTVQFHPERLADRYPAHQAIFGAFVGACGH